MAALVWKELLDSPQEGGREREREGRELEESSEKAGENIRAIGQECVKVRPVPPPLILRPHTFFPVFVCVVGGRHRSCFVPV